MASQKNILAPAMFACTLGAIAPVHAAEILSGTWIIDGSIKPTCSFVLKGRVLSGSCTGLLNDGPISGSVNGKNVKWVWDAKNAAGIFTTEFVGTWDLKDTITGQWTDKTRATDRAKRITGVVNGVGVAVASTATRQAIADARPDLTGIWQLTGVPDGINCVLAQKGKALSGTCQAQLQGAVDGSVDGRTVSWTWTAHFPDGTRVTWQFAGEWNLKNTVFGKLTNDTIKTQSVISLPDGTKPTHFTATRQAGK